VAHLSAMKQNSLDLCLCTRKARKQVFLQQMENVVPWAALVEIIAPYYSEGRKGRPPFALETMLRVHFMQQWFSLSDPAMEEAFFDIPLYREFAQLDAFGRLPDESAIPRFRHQLEKHKLANKILVTVVDADSGLVHTVRGTSGNVADVTEGNSLLHGQEGDVFGDAGYQGADKRPDTKTDCKWHVERGHVPEHPFQVIQRRFGYIKGRYPGLKMNNSADQDADAVVQFANGSSQIDRGACMSASKNGQIAFKGLQIEPVGGKFRLKRDQVEPNLTRRKAIGRGARLLVSSS